MKILFGTDSHVTTRTPAGRTDNFPTTLVAKYQQIKLHAESSNVDLIIHGGDMFHSPAIDRGLAGQIAQVIKDMPCPVYVVPGNHDIYGYNPNTLYHTTLGLFIRSGVVRLLDRENIISNDDVIIQGQPYYGGIDKRNKDYDYSFIEDERTKLLVAHGMVLPKPWIEEIPTTLISELPKGPDVLFCGHYHPGFKEEYSPHGALVLNPGSLARIECSASNVYHTPKILIGELANHTFKYEEVLLDVPSFDDVFSSYAKVKEEKKQRKSSADKFSDYLKTIKQEESSFQQALNELLEEQTEETASFVKTILANTEIEKEDPIPYPSQQKIIKDIELTNFQSHKDTIITLSSGLNAIVGPSDQGKSAMLRAAKWALYNDPKGREADAFIRIGQEETSVSITMDNGDIVTRSRPKKSGTGMYSLIRNGEKDVYTGFGLSVPPDIVLATGHAAIPIAAGIEKSLLVSDQHEGAFLITESAPAKASILGKIAGTESADESMKAIASDMNYLTKEEKKEIERLSNLEEELDKYNDIPMVEENLEQIKASIEEAESLQLKWSALSETFLNLTNAESAINALQVKLDDHNVKLATQEQIEQTKSMMNEVKTMKEYLHQEDKVSQILDMIDVCNTKLDSIEMVERVKNNLNGLQVMSSYLQKEVECMEREEKITSLIDKLKAEDLCINTLASYQSLARLKKFQEAQDTVDSVDTKLKRYSNISQMVSKLEKANELLEMQKELSKIRRKYSSIATTYNQAKKRVSDFDSTLFEKQQHLNDLWEEHGNCPTCGQLVTQDAVQELISNF